MFFGRFLCTAPCSSIWYPDTLCPLSSWKISLILHTPSSIHQSLLTLWPISYPDRLAITCGLKPPMHTSPAGVNPSRINVSNDLPGLKEVVLSARNLYESHALNTVAEAT